MRALFLVLLCSLLFSTVLATPISFSGEGNHWVAARILAPTNRIVFQETQVFDGEVVRVIVVYRPDGSYWDQAFHSSHSGRIEVAANAGDRPFIVRPDTGTVTQRATSGVGCDDCILEANTTVVFLTAGLDPTSVVHTTR